jgi:hypothetical protein
MEDGKLKDRSYEAGKVGGNGMRNAECGMRKKGSNGIRNWELGRRKIKAKIRKDNC